VQIFFYPVGGYGLVAALAALLFGLLIAVPLSSKATGQRRKTLLALRVGTLILLVLALLRPTIVYTTTKRQASTLVVLVDRSRSMQVADVFGNQTRWQALQLLLGKSAPALTRLQQDFEVKFYTFDSNARPVAIDGGKLDLGAKADGSESAIGAALAEVLKREAGKRLAGIVLLSDGAQRALTPNDLAPQIPARQLADLGFPLHTVAFGQARSQASARDVALTGLQTPADVFVKNELAITALAKTHGFANQKVPIEMLFETAPGKMTTVAKREIIAQADGQPLPIELTYLPQTPGDFKVTVRAQPPSGDAAPANNELSTFVTVRKGGVNVLYLEGAHPVEAKFLRRALQAFPDLRIDYLWLDAQAKDTRPADLASRFEPGKYDVYILGDLDSSIFEAPELARLAETVRAGAGLIMLGGLHSFGPGGYQKTPLAEVLPIQMSNLERQNFGEEVAVDLHLPGPMKMRPTAEGEASRLLLLGQREENQALWAKLPPLDGANRFRGLSPLANVLAESVDASRAPLLVAQTPGNGRVLAFAGDSTWHWAMAGFEDQHQRFWRQLILWLAKKEQQDGSIWVQLAQRRFQRGARVEFEAGVLAKDGEPTTDAQLNASLTLPDGAKRQVRLVRQGEKYVGSFYETDLAGDYTLTAQAERGAENLGTASVRFLVYEQDLELENPAADPSLLASLAAMTDGRAMVPDELFDFFERLGADHRPDAEVEVLAKHTPWDTWPYFLGLVGLLCVEWWLRKRWGLV
jgi:uncharacterized membrane protein